MLTEDTIFMRQMLSVFRCQQFALRASGDLAGKVSTSDLEACRPTILGVELNGQYDAVHACRNYA